MGGWSGGTRGRARRDRGMPASEPPTATTDDAGFSGGGATTRARRAAGDEDRARTCCFPILDAIADVPGSDTPRARPVAAPRARVLTPPTTPAAPDDQRVSARSAPRFFKSEEKFFPSALLT